MTAIDIARKVRDEQTAVLYRERAGSSLEGITEYDCKPLNQGSKHGWTILDLFSAGAICTVYDNLQKPENRVKYESFGPAGMAHVAFKLMNKR